MSSVGVYADFDPERPDTNETITSQGRESLMSFRRITAASLSLALFCVITATTSVKADNRDEIVFFFNDSLGSAVAAVNEAGELCWDEVYTPYGDKTINDDLVNVTGCGIVGEERGFTGHTEDVNSDLVYMQQRYYDPSIGRFLSIDPLDANPNNPMTYNRYAYANNNPYRYVDPDGELPVLAWGVYVGVTAALTAYGSYRAYQEGGAGALVEEIVVGAAVSVIPGGRIAKSTLGTAAEVAERVGDVPNAGAPVLRSAGAAVNRTVEISQRQLQRKFKHANHFGVDGNFNSANASRFRDAINAHTRADSTLVIQGTYRGQDVTHFVDPSNGLNVIRDANGAFLSGWKLGAEQLKNVLGRGSL